MTEQGMDDGARWLYFPTKHTHQSPFTMETLKYDNAAWLEDYFLGTMGRGMTERVGAISFVGVAKRTEQVPTERVGMIVLIFPEKKYLSIPFHDVDMNKRQRSADGGLFSQIDGKRYDGVRWRHFFCWCCGEDVAGPNGARWRDCAYISRQKIPINLLSR